MAIDENRIPTAIEANRFAEYIIDDSAAVTIPMPEVLKPTLERGNSDWPTNYWPTFNKGMDLYSSSQFEDARDEFVKLTEYSTSHQALYPSLVRTYRKIINEKIESREFIGAYKQFGEFFRLCKGHITQRDVSNLNKVASEIESIDPMPELEPIEVPSVKRNLTIPEVQINNSASDDLVLIGEIPRAKDKLVLDELDRREDRGDEPRPRRVFGRYRDIGLTSQGTIFARSYFKSELQAFDSAFVLLRYENGSVVKEWSLSHSLYRFGSASESNTFVGISDEAVLYIYSLVHGCLGTYHINEALPDIYKTWPFTKYSLRSASISPDGEFVMFTNDGRAWLLDSDLRPVVCWVPDESKHVVPTIKLLGSERKQSFEVLGLTEDCTVQEIKNAFKGKILQNHPDLHPDDPDAHDRTIEILNAYQILTGESAKEDDFQDMEITISFPGFGGDWVYAAWLAPHAESLYLGYYSGKVRHINRDGIVREIYECNDPIRSIRALGNRLLVQTDYAVYTIEENRCIANVPVTFDFRWTEFGFISINAKDKEVTIFLSDGREVGRIKFKNTIYDAYTTSNILEVVTHYKRYLFEISQSVLSL